MTIRLCYLKTIIFTALCGSTSAMATNGMLMEGYGPESTALGGAAAAVENGTAGMINNPATLGMMIPDSSRLDISLGNLRPDVKSTLPTPQGNIEANSSGDSYLMPAIGYVRNKGQISYGVGIFAQGGMGTEYSENSPLLGARSEISVGNLLIPIAYQLNNKLTLGGTIKYVWGGMDLIMGMPLFDPAGNPSAGTFADFSQNFGGSNVLGEASGSLLQGFGNLLASIPQEELPNHAAEFDFSNSSDYSGKVNGTGFGAALGLTYRVNDSTTLGFSYHTETFMEDWEGKGSLRVVNTADGSIVAEFPGTYTIKDFQFPSILTLGMAVTINPRWLVAADISQIDWSGTLSSFDLNFSTVTTEGAAEADISMKQEWDDQTVLKLGSAFRATDNLILRFGINAANNPIPDEFMNPLFPAIIENHVTTGFSYSVTPKSLISGSLVHAPTVTQTNSNTQVETEHAQTNLQIMYSYTF